MYNGKGGKERNECEGDSEGERNDEGERTEESAKTAAGHAINYSNRRNRRG